MANAREVFDFLVGNELGEGDNSLFIDSFVLGTRVCLVLGNGALEGSEAVFVSDGHLVIRRDIDHFVEILEGLRHVVESHLAPRALVQSQWRFGYVVGIGKGFSRVFIGPCCHEQIPSVYVDHWILWLQDNNFLKVHKGKACVSNQICAFASVEVCIKEIFIQVNSN